MTRYARRPEARRGRQGWIAAGVSGAASAAARNPVAVGGTTAFLVSLAFVSANALFYQPQVHPNAFLATREMPAPHVIPDLPRPQAAPRDDDRQETLARQASVPEPVMEPELEATGSVPESGDSTVRQVQAVLSDLGLYHGTIDGMTGPQTAAAVESYRRIVGLEPGTAIDAALLRQLGLKDNTASVIPAPAPRPPRGESPNREGPMVQTVSADPGELPRPQPSLRQDQEGDAVLRRVQAGLKAFGNDGIEIDGVMGERTRAAISEFQSLFGLPVTGEADPALIAKMQEIGLIR